jgi:hypothetical protein
MKCPEKNLHMLEHVLRIVLGIIIKDIHEI